MVATLRLDFVDDSEDTKNPMLSSNVLCTSVRERNIVKDIVKNRMQNLKCKGQSPRTSSISERARKVVSKACSHSQYKACTPYYPLLKKWIGLGVGPLGPISWNNPHQALFSLYCTLSSNLLVGVSGPKY